ncbi:MAG: DUF2130 domain-containing protein [Cocleimonas sp.]|nr:DUF2130 domain-containing protein [Cocleimonas sp.]
MTKNKSQAIQCPECGAEIEISEVLSSQLEKDLRKNLQAENDSKLKAAVDKVKQDVAKQSTLEIKDLENQLKEREDESLVLRKQARELEAQKEDMEDEITRRVKDGEKVLQTKLTDQIKQSLEQEKATELLDLQSQLDDKNKNLAKAQELELALRKQARELEDKQKDLNITLERKLDEGRKEIADKLAEKYANEENLKLKEKEQQIDSLRKSLEDAKRKSEQGSQETQGEALEADLESKLRVQFPHDEIAPVSKGVRGADIIQTVINLQLACCGKILWEAKNTKTWTQGWIQKLKDDQLATGANIAMLVSVTLPQGMTTFAQVDGVWVCSPSSAIPLVSALREQLIAVNFAQCAGEGKDEKMEMMFSYLSGDEFRQRVEALVDTFDSMTLQLHKERRAMESLWKTREKQIQRISTNTTGMYGDIRGIIGNSVQEIKALELDDGLDLLDAPAE